MIAEASFGKQLDEEGFHFVRRYVRSVALHDAALPIDEEFREIPFDRFRPQQSARFPRQLPVERMGVRPAHVDLGEQREGNAVVQPAFALDRLLIARLLTGELITRKAEHAQTLAAVCLVKPLQLPELRREAASSRRVDDDQHISAIDFKCRRFPVNRANFGVVAHVGSNPLVTIE